MLGTEIVSDIQNNFCTQHVLQKEELLTKIYMYQKTQWCHLRERPSLAEVFFYVLNVLKIQERWGCVYEENIQMEIDFSKFTDGQMFLSCQMWKKYCFGNSLFAA